MENSKPGKTDIKILYYFCVLFLCVIVLLEQFNVNKVSTVPINKPINFSSNWQRVYSEEKKVPIEIPCKVTDVKKGEKVVLETRIPSFVIDSTYIYIRSSQQEVFFYVDGKLRKKYDLSDESLFGNATASAFVLCPMERGDRGKTLRVELSSPTSFYGTINPIYYGDEFNIWYQITHKNMFEAFVGVFMMLIGIVVVLVGVFLYNRYKANHALEFMGWILFEIGILVISESQIRQLFAKNISALGVNSYFTLPLIMTAIIFFSDEITGKRYHKAYKVMSIWSLLLLFFIPAVVFTGIMEMLNTLWLVLITAVAYLIITGINMYKDAKAGLLTNYYMVILGIVIFLLIGGLGHLLVNVIDILDSTGPFVCVGVIFLLIATLIYTINNIENVNAQKNKAEYERLAKDKLFAQLSHEIRTPLNAVLGMNELIKRESKEANITQYSQAIEYSGSMLLNLINDILDFSKAEAGDLALNPVEFNTADMILDTINIVDKRVKDKKLEFIKHIDPKLPKMIFADDVRIKQIIINILTNAIKYTETGSVTYTVNKVYNDDLDLCMRISVQDTGQGIKKENLDSIFSSFTRVNEKKNRNIEGTGLGLSITKYLVELMNGSINVESEFMKGSTFTIVLPIKPVGHDDMGPLDNTSLNEEERVADEVFMAPDAKILIVDDSKVNLSVIKGLLKNSRMNIETASSGMECLEKCKHFKYDLILMDHLMPEMDGMETFKNLRASDYASKDVKVAIVTANAYGDIKDEFMETGFDAYLSKPIQVKQLNEMLLELLPEGYMGKIDTGKKN